MVTPGDIVVCTCGHDAAAHIRGSGRCREQDADGNCDCRAFESAASEIPERR